MFFFFVFDVLIESTNLLKVIFLTSDFGSAWHRTLFIDIILIEDVWKWSKFWEYFHLLWTRKAGFVMAACGFDSILSPHGFSRMHMRVLGNKNFLFRRSYSRAKNNIILRAVPSSKFPTAGTSQRQSQAHFKEAWILQALFFIFVFVNFY